jgi:hypothetical protein
MPWIRIIIMIRLRGLSLGQRVLIDTWLLCCIVADPRVWPFIWPFSVPTETS